MGEAARAEARLAVKLDPNSALAERVLAEILKHDLVGRNLRAGSDLAGAAEAYRAAIKLDPDDHTAQGDLAILLEYDSVGRRYSGQAHMKEAVAEYREAGPGQAGRSRPRQQSCFRAFLWRRICGSVQGRADAESRARAADVGQHGHARRTARRAWLRPTSAPPTTRRSKRPRAPRARC